LTDNGVPASGSFQMQFKLFDALSGGAQIGSTIADLPVAATIAALQHAGAGSHGKSRACAGGWARPTARNQPGDACK
jgi:hypothetical protein